MQAKIVALTPRLHDQGAREPGPERTKMPETKDRSRRITTVPKVVVTAPTLLHHSGGQSESESIFSPACRDDDRTKEDPSPQFHDINPDTEQD